MTVEIENEDTGTKRRVRSPREKAYEAAETAQRKYERKAAQHEKALDEASRLEDEVAQLKADADFLNSHPLLSKD